MQSFLHVESLVLFSISSLWPNVLLAVHFLVQVAPASSKQSMIMIQPLTTSILYRYVPHSTSRAKYIAFCHKAFWHKHPNPRKKRHLTSDTEHSQQTTVLLLSYGMIHHIHVTLALLVLLANTAELYIWSYNEIITGGILWCLPTSVSAQWYLQAYWHSSGTTFSITMLVLSIAQLSNVYQSG